MRCKSVCDVKTFTFVGESTCRQNDWHSYHWSSDCFEYPKKSTNRKKNFKPQKILWLSPSLEIRSTPPGIKPKPHMQGNAFLPYLFLFFWILLYKLKHTNYGNAITKRFNGYSKHSMSLGYLWPGLSTLPDNPGDSRFWTVSPSLQIRVSNLPDNCQSLSFLVRPGFHNNNILNILSCLTILLSTWITKFPHKLQQTVVLANVATVM